MNRRKRLVVCAWAGLLVTSLLSVSPSAAESENRADSIEKPKIAKDASVSVSEKRPKVAASGVDVRAASSAAVTPVVPAADAPEGPTRLAPLQGSRLVELESPGGMPTPDNEIIGEGTDVGQSENVVGPTPEVGTASPAVSTWLNQVSASPPLRSSLVSPADNAVNVSRTLKLTAKIAEPSPGQQYQFLFTICPGVQHSGSSSCRDVQLSATSGWTTSASWTVPAGKLAANKTYSWSVAVTAGSGKPSTGTIFNDIRVFATGATLSAPDSATPVLVSPADASVLSTRTPVLRASISRPVAGATYQYQFSLESFDGSISWNSSWQGANSITVPATVMYWNRGYTWTVAIRDSPYMGTIFNPERTFYPVVPVPTTATLIEDRHTPYDHGVSIGSGAFTSTSTDASVSAAGAPLTIARSYRSVDTSVRVLGTGWSSLLDMKVSTPAGSPGPVVRFADGHEETFATDPNGTYAGAPGNLKTQFSKSGTNWVVKDPQGVIYTLDAAGLLSITNQSGNTASVTRTSGKPTLVKDAKSGRGLAFTWTGAHVTAIAATPAPSGVVAKWTYQYSGDKLTKACVPHQGTTVRCTSYAYGDAANPSAITTITSPSGVVRARVAYGPGSKAVSTTDAGGNQRTFERTATPSGTSVVAAGSGSGETKYALDKSSRLTSFEDALGSSQNWAYDAAGRLGRYESPGGGAIELEYDDYGNIVRRTSWRTLDQAISQCFTYYPAGHANAGRLKSLQDPRGLGCGDSEYLPGIDMTSFTYDAGGRLASRVSGPLAGSPTAPKVSYAYTLASDVAIGGGTVPAGLLKSKTTPSGAKTSYAYDSGGSLRTETSPSGLITRHTYDSLGRQTQTSATVSGQDTAIVRAYFDDSTPRSVTGPRVDDQISGVSRRISSGIELDADGQVIASIESDLESGDSLETVNNYDDLGRLQSTVAPDGDVVVAYTYDARGNIESVTDAAGAVTEFTYDVQGRRLTTTLQDYDDPADERPPRDILIESLTYDREGHVVERVDANGQNWGFVHTLDGLLAKVTAEDALDGQDAVTFEAAYDAIGNPISGSENGTWWVSSYDSQGRLASTDVQGRVSSFTYDPSGRLTRESLSQGGVVDHYKKYTYDAGDRVSSVETGRAQEERYEQYTYDEAGRLKTYADPRAAAWEWLPLGIHEYHYGIDGNLVSRTEPLAAVYDSNGTRSIYPETQYGYDPFGRRSVAIDANGGRTDLQYDRAGRVVTTTLPSAIASDGDARRPSLSRSYDSSGRLISSTSPLGHETTYRYDTRGQIVEVVEPPAGPGQSAPVTKVTYSDSGLPIRSVDPTGVVKDASYDGLGRLIGQSVIVTGGPITTRFERDLPGNITAVTHPDGGQDRASYNKLGQVTSTLDADGVSMFYAYDAAGRLTRETSASAVTVSQYNGLGELTNQSVRSGENILASRAWSYDPLGNVETETNPLGAITTRYWERGQPSSIKFPGGAEAKAYYDALGNRTKVVDQRGNATEMTWNAWGLQTEVLESSTLAHPFSVDRTWVGEYDVDGNAVRVTAPGGVVSERSFDPAGRLLTEEASGGRSPDASRAFTYDAAGKMSSASHPDGSQTFSYNERGLLSSSQGPSGAASYEYDSLGRESARTDENGTMASTWTPGGRIERVAIDSSEWTFDYDSSGRASRQSLPGGLTRTLEYDGLSNKTADVLRHDSSVLYGWNASYDAASRLSAETVAPDGVAGAGTTEYAYDANNRLTSWTEANGSAHSIEYDTANNITNYDGEARHYDQRNRLVTAGSKSVTWSPRGTQDSVTEGSTTTTRSFDALDRLVDDGSDEYEYDSLDRISSAAGTDFTYAGLDREPISDGESGWQRSANGDLLTSNDQPLITNHRGDVLGMVDGTALVGSKSYAPYGPIRDAVGGQTGALGYQGQWVSASDLVHAQARWYDPSAGAFISRDAASLPLGTDNRYSYTAGNPIAFFDPSGRTAIPVPIGPWTLTPQGAAITGAAVIVSGGIVAWENGAFDGVRSIFGGGSSSATVPMFTDLPAFGVPAVPARSAASAAAAVSAVSLPSSAIDSSGLSRSMASAVMGLSAMNASIDRALGGLASANRGVSQMNAAFATMNAGIDQALAGIDQALAGIDQVSQALSLMASQLAQLGLGADWATRPDTSERLTVREADVQAASGVLPIDSQRLCAVSAASCRAVAAETGVGAISTSVDPRASYTVAEPNPPTPLLGGGGGGRKPPKGPTYTDLLNPDDDDNEWRDDPGLGPSDPEFSDAGNEVTKPEVGSGKLQNIINNLYDGIENEMKVGNGTTMDAIRYERATGETVHGRMHTQKGWDSLRGLNKWLRQNPNGLYSDKLVARSLADELSILLRGAP